VNSVICTFVFVTLLSFSCLCIYLNFVLKILGVANTHFVNTILFSKFLETWKLNFEDWYYVEGWDHVMVPPKFSYMGLDPNSAGLIFKAALSVHCWERLFPRRHSFFLKVKQKYIRQASRLIKNLPVPLGTLVRKRVRLKLAAENHNIITSFTRLSRMKLGGSSTQLQVTLEV
jgi:hypothetical protein